jgi:hypothetical protein
MRAAGGQAQAPDALDSLNDYAGRALHAVSPQAYVNFLRDAAGLDPNATVTYAARQRAPGGGITLLGPRESNLDFHGAGSREQVLLGETGGA